MTKEKKINSFVKEMVDENAFRIKGDFWKIQRCHSVVSWGGVEPLEYPECKVKIVWLSFSPHRAGEKGLVLYDCISCNEFGKKKDTLSARTGKKQSHKA